MIRTKSFYALWICFIIGTYIGLSIVGIATTYAIEVVGLNKQFATYLLSFFAIFNGLGRPLFGYLVDKLGTKKTIYLSYILIITASLLQIFKGHNIYFFVIGFVLFFMNLGGWLSIVPAANINIFGRKFSTQNYGILFTAYGIGAFFQGMIGGYIKEKFGSYIYMFYPFIGLCV
ncbi:MAG: MFS transporter, partial [Fusobacteriaceae bacterium]|nr:MFS transporter [Fusobacteriaceae bacterium]